ncbi:hypothetical protein IVB22_26735 [Bradyrhizobium sp. 190]|nr:hypothetical protein [Bradyrhizobium sp. 190]
MFTIQSLWTQAREGAQRVTVVFAKPHHQILRGEFDGVGPGRVVTAPTSSTRHWKKLD